MMKTLAEQIGNKCVHFNGIGLDDKKCCRAGIAYVTVENKEVKGFERWPCFSEGVAVPCEKRHFPTPEEVAAKVAEMEAFWARTKLALAAAGEDAKKHGFKKGAGGEGKVTCPACKTGELHYSVSSYNGHMWGKCSTAECVSWMQ